MFYHFMHSQGGECMIELLVGHISSGKSTYSKSRAHEGWIIINDDAIVNSVHANQYTLYQERLKPLYKGIEVFLLNTAVAMGLNVVVDKGLNLSATSRQRWISLARSLDVPIHCVVFDAFEPEVHARRRVEDDARGWDYVYWLKVAKHHASVYDVPQLEEGFEEIRFKPWE
jgi:predicted kinase